MKKVTSLFFTLLLQCVIPKTSLFRGFSTDSTRGKRQDLSNGLCQTIRDSTASKPRPFNRVKSFSPVRMSSSNPYVPLLNVRLLAHSSVDGFDHITPFLALIRILRELLQGVRIYFLANPRVTCVCSNVLPSDDLLNDLRESLIDLQTRRHRLPVEDRVRVASTSTAFTSESARF